MSLRARAAVRPYYGLAALVLLAGILVAGWWVTDLLLARSRVARLPVPGEHQLHLGKAGSYSIAYEYPGAADDRGPLPALDLRLTGPDGVPLPLSPTRTSGRYTFGSRTGRQALDFRVARAGTYLLSGHYPEDYSGPEVTLAVGRDLYWKAIRGILGSLAVLGASLGLARLITLVAERKERAIRQRILEK